MIYDVNITYGAHAGYSGKGGETLEQAQLEMERMLQFYSHYTITEAYIASYCPECTQGKVLKCVARRRHNTGYHDARCAKICTTCKGHYETRYAGTNNA
jgi:predicted RNA-binding Zn-ribbon protein involved in translation (DUF1610 family)